MPSMPSNLDTNNDLTKLLQLLTNNLNSGRLFIEIKQFRLVTLVRLFYVWQHNQQLPETTNRQGVG
jgi:hypothetical protein